MRRQRALTWLISGTVALGLILAIAWIGATAREAQGESACKRNLLDIGLALDGYVNTHGHFPPASVPNEALPPEKRLSWLVAVLPFIEGGGPWLIDEASAWDEGRNRVLRRRDKFSDEFLFVEGQDTYHFFHCPLGGGPFDANGFEQSSYVGIAGLGPDAPSLPLEDPRAGLFGDDRVTPPEAITDGFSTTMAIAETAESNGPWKAGGPATVRGLDPGRQPYIGPGRQFGGMHRGGAMVAFADGSVRVIRPTIDPKVFEALSTIAGGEPLPTDWSR